MSPISGDSLHPFLDIAASPEIEISLRVSILSIKDSPDLNSNTISKRKE
jgi:hypothetical protein